MRLDDVIEHFLLDCSVRARAVGTLENYKQRLVVLMSLLKQLYGLTELEQVKVLHLRKCVQHLLTEEIETYQGRKLVKIKLEVSTVKAYVRVWKAFFNWCFQEELINQNPVSRLVAPKTDERIKPTFTPEHIERMLAQCDVSTEMGFRNYVMLLLLLDTGMRLAELSNLRVDDIHDTYVKVFGKGRKEREIGIHPEVGKLLWKYIHKYRHPHNPNETALFIGRGEPLGRGGIKKVLRCIQRDSGLGDIKLSAHVFRHTFAKMYLQRGGEVFKLSREMGHSQVQVTEIYLKDFGSTEARKEHNDFSPIGNIKLPKNKRRKDKNE